MILTGKPEISSNLLKHFANGCTETRWFIGIRNPRVIGNRNNTACFKISRKRHASVFKVKRMATNHQNVAITSSADRKQFQATKKLCFNCTGPHKSSECKSIATCQTCGKRHHTSICGLSKEVKTEGVLTAHQPENKEVVYPIVLVEIDGIKTYALLDTGARSLYASTILINLLNKRPKETATKRIDMMLGSSTTNIEIYSATLGAVDGKFDMNIELTKVHKPQLLTLDNPNYATLLSKYSHLNGVKIEDNDTRLEIPIHVVLGTSEYATIKTSTAQRVGKPGQPVAEKTLLGWTLMSPGREDIGSPMLLTQSALTEYEQLCALDVPGLADTHED